MESLSQRSVPFSYVCPPHEGGCKCGLGSCELRARTSACALFLQKKKTLGAMIRAKQRYNAECFFFFSIIMGGGDDDGDDEMMGRAICAPTGPAGEDWTTGLAFVWRPCHGLHQPWHGADETR